MKTHLSIPSPLWLTLVFAAESMLLASVSVAQTPAAAPGTTPAKDEASTAGTATVLRMSDLIWRTAQNQADAELGLVTDVLVHMPDGRIVFVAVAPSDSARRPKVVPPKALVVSGDARAPVHLDIAEDRWSAAPILDWSGAMVVRLTDEGRKVYGYYQQRWFDPPPVPVWWTGKVSLDTAPAGSERYVSLRRLLNERVVNRRDRQVGYLADFVLNWADQRVTHALVSPNFPPVPEKKEPWYAVPVGLLQPPTDYDVITVNADPRSFERAPTVAQLDQLAAQATVPIQRWTAPPAASRAATAE